MIPAHIDLIAIFNDLNGLGISDYKVEAMCGLAEGHVGHLRAGRRKQMLYSNTARIYNLWCEEMTAHASKAIRHLDNCQGIALTT